MSEGWAAVPLHTPPGLLIFVPELCSIIHSLHLDGVHCYMTIPIINKKGSRSFKVVCLFSKWYHGYIENGGSEVQDF